MIVQRIYLGSKRVPRIYKGTTLVWRERNAPTHSETSASNAVLLKYLADVSVATGYPVTIVYAEAMQSNAAPFAAHIIPLEIQYNEAVQSNAAPFAAHIIPLEVCFSEATTCDFTPFYATPAVSRIDRADVLKSVNNPTAGRASDAKLSLSEVAASDFKPKSGYAFIAGCDGKVIIADTHVASNAIAFMATGNNAVCVSSDVKTKSARSIPTEAASKIIGHSVVTAGSSIMSEGTSKTYAVFDIYANCTIKDGEYANTNSLQILVGKVAGALGTAAAAMCGSLEALSDTCEPSVGTGIPAVVVITELTRSLSECTNADGVTTSAENNVELHYVANPSLSYGIHTEALNELLCQYDATACTANSITTSTHNTLYDAHVAEAIEALTLLAGVSTYEATTMTAEPTTAACLTTSSYVRKVLTYISEATTCTPVLGAAFYSIVTAEDATASVGDTNLANGTDTIVHAHSVKGTKVVASRSIVTGQVCAISNATAESMFIWIYPEWLDDNSLYIRCGHEVSQVGNTLYID